MRNTKALWIFLVATLPLMFATPSFSDAPQTYLGAVALNVKNLEKSTAFYQTVFGMQVNRSINNESMDENIMGFADGAGASLVLVQYKSRDLIDEKTARIVFYAPDPKAVLAKGVEQGATVVREAREIASMNTMIGIMRDLDGYNVEVIRTKK